MDRENEDSFNMFKGGSSINSQNLSHTYSNNCLVKSNWPQFYKYISQLIKRGWHHFFYTGIKCSMKLALFILAALLAAAWIIGFFIFKTGTMIHVLMIAAVLLFMQAIIVSPRRNRVIDTESAY